MSLDLLTCRQNATSFHMTLESLLPRPGRIRIIRTPDGEAPEEVRSKWIGVEIRCFYYIRSDPEHPNPHFRSYGVVSGKEQRIPEIYVVSQVEALDALFQSSPEAANWWFHHGYPTNPEAVFWFNMSCAEEVEKVYSEAQMFGANN